MDAEMILWTEIHKASDAFGSLALAPNDTTNRYRGIPSAGSTVSKELRTPNRMNATVSGR